MDIHRLDLQGGEAALTEAVYQRLEKRRKLINVRHWANVRLVANNVIYARPLRDMLSITLTAEVGNGGVITSSEATGVEKLISVDALQGAIIKTVICAAETLGERLEAVSQYRDFL